MNIIKFSASLLLAAVVAVAALGVLPQTAYAAPATMPGLYASWQDSTKAAANAVWYTNQGSRSYDTIKATISTPNSALSVDCSRTFFQYANVARNGGWVTLPASVASVTCTPSYASGSVTGMPVGYQARLFTVMVPTGDLGVKTVNGFETDLRQGIQIGTLSQAAYL